MNYCLNCQEPGHRRKTCKNPYKKHKCDCHCPSRKAHENKMYYKKKKNFNL